MRYLNSKWLIMAIVLAASPVFAQAVPPFVNYQGRLMDSGGMPVTGSVPATFTLWDGATAGTMLWTESKAVEVSGGLYSVLLGDSVAIPASVFSGSAVYLEVTVMGETLAPRERMTAVPYAFHASDADNLGGIPASSYAQVGNIDFSGITGTATDAQIPDNITISLAQNSTDLGGLPAADYVLVAGDTVTGDLQINGTLHGHPDLNVSNNLSVLGGHLGIGTAPNPSQGVADSAASPPIYGAVLFGSSTGVVGRISSDATISGTLAGSGIAVSGLAGNSSSNSGMTAGYFKAESKATSTGVQSWATGDGPSPAIAFASNATNNNAGNTYGASFTASSPGTGVHYGTYSASYSGSSLQSYGIYALGYNSLGDSYGGYFMAQNSASGTHYGIYATASDYPGYFEWTGNPSSNYAYLSGQSTGIFTHAGDSSDTSNDYGGILIAASQGPTIGSWGIGYGYGANDAVGVEGYATNSVSGKSYGGYFTSTLGGTGLSYGVYALGATTGVYAEASNGTGIYGQGNQFGTYGAWSPDPGNNYGDLGSQFDGVYGLSGPQTSTQSKNGGYFQAFSQADATGVYGEAIGYGASPAYGVQGYSYNSAGGTAYGAYLYASASPGAAYGLYVASGAKNWVNPDPEDATKAVAYVTVESGENVTYYSSQAILVNGSTTIILPDHFRKVTSPEYPVTVQLTPRSADSMGLAVIASSNSSVKVVELMHGHGNYQFDYTIKGMRRGYEKYQPIIDNVDYVPFQGNLSKMDSSKMTTQEFYDRQSTGMKKIFEQNGTLDKNGKVNEAAFQARGWKEVKVRTPEHGPGRE